jgi:hypothetical protein
MDNHFIYILTGWEDSIDDSRILYDILSKDFRIPDGKYFLTDTDISFFLI